MKHYCSGSHLRRCALIWHFSCSYSTSKQRDGRAKGWFWGSCALSEPAWSARPDSLVAFDFQSSRFSALDNKESVETLNIGDSPRNRMKSMWLTTWLVFDFGIMASSFTLDSDASSLIPGAPLIRYLTHLSWLEDLINGPETQPVQFAKQPTNYVKHPTVILPRYCKKRKRKVHDSATCSTKGSTLQVPFDKRTSKVRVISNGFLWGAFFR